MITAALLMLAQAGVGPGEAARANRPAKMFVLANNGVAITDYPSMARCEASKIDLQKQASKVNAATPSYQPLPGGGAIITAPINFQAICFLA